MNDRAVLALSFAALLYERLWARFWPAASVLAAWAGVTLMRLPAPFGTWAQAGTGILFLSAFIYALLRGARSFRLPGRDDVDRRIEIENGLNHRPLSALRDRPATAAGAALWQAHLRRIAPPPGSLKTCRPRPDTARRDPRGLRHAALLLLAVGLVVAGDDAAPRLRDGLLPAPPLELARKKAQGDVWIVPPAHTRRPPVFLTAAQKGAVVAEGPVSVPIGSMLKARLTGTQHRPRGRHAGESFAFTPAGGGSHMLEMPLDRAGRLLLRDGYRETGAWEINIVPDLPPRLEISSVGETQRALLKISWRTEDDYGLADLAATVVPEGPEGAAETVTFDLPVASGENSFTVDLTALLHAGMPATLTLAGTDAAGQAAMTGPRAFILPQRTFTNPLSRRLAEERRKLTAARDPLSLRATAQTLFDIGGNPALFNHDSTVFMALGMAARRLVYDGGAEAVDSVQRILWDTALRLEDGGISAASRDLGTALQKLSLALADEKTGDAEIKALMEEAQKEMQDYMRALAAELSVRLRDDRRTPVLPPDLAQKFMKHVDLEDMMRQMRALSENNPREAMRRMTEFLKNAVENLDLNGIGRMQEKQAQAMQALQDMQEIIRDQQSLMDETGRAAPEDENDELAEKQKALHDRLDAALRKAAPGMKTAPESLAGAGDAMRRAQAALEKAAVKDALPHQKRALDALRRGLDKAVEEMARNMQMTILSFGAPPGGGGYGAGFDPLGRDMGEKESDGSVTIPDEKERRRVQEIIRALRDRAGDHRRPKVERDYIDRLLDRTN